MDDDEKKWQELFVSIQNVHNEMHGLKSEIVRLERMIRENEKNMKPVVDVYRKISASSEVGGFLAKLLGGILGIAATIIGLWLAFRGNFSGQ